MSNTKTESFAFRKDLVDMLGNEAGKTIYRQFTQNDKYTQHDLNYIEMKQLIDSTYAAIYEVLYKDRYGEVIAKELVEEKKRFEEENKKEIESDTIKMENRAEKRKEKKKKND